MHFLLKHKMLQIVLKVSLYMAPTCFGPSWTIIREHTIGALLKLQFLLNHHLKYIIKIVGVQWQYEYQVVVCKLSAVRRTALNVL